MNEKESLAENKTNRDAPNLEKDASLGQEDHLCPQILKACFPIAAMKSFLFLPKDVTIVIMTNESRLL
jgi:hypothetical protein